MSDDFDQKKLALQSNAHGLNILGVQQWIQSHLSVGMSSQVSGFGFVIPIGDEDTVEIPDYVLSGSLEKDIETTIAICVNLLKLTKYLPDSTEFTGSQEVVAEDKGEGAFLTGWQDFEISGFSGEFVYTEADLRDGEEIGQNAVAIAMWFIVKDICNDCRILSPEWYQARIIMEYFLETPVPPENAFLIGNLASELRMKQRYEGDLRGYYHSLSAKLADRQKGANATKEKAEELREFCVRLFADLAISSGPRLMMAPAMVQARELQTKALVQRPNDFMRAGKPYSEEWFLKNIIEDRNLEIVKLIEEKTEKKML